jgi:hypothetical protein
MNKLGKLITVSIVLILVIGLPVVSYYYLKSGYLFRKDALEYMQLNIPVDYQDIDPTGDIETKLNSEVQLIHFQQDSVDKSQLERLGKVQELFNESDKFSILTIGNAENLDPFLSSKISQASNWHYIANQAYLDTLNIFSKEKLLLIDSIKMARAQYSFDEKQMGDLVKHITVLFPIKKRSKIRLERETKK